jgi:hypothetical protein
VTRAQSVAETRAKDEEEVRKKKLARMVSEAMSPTQDGEKAAPATRRGKKGGNSVSDDVDADDAQVDGDEREREQRSNDDTVTQGSTKNAKSTARTAK